jgi:23S rRNA (guanosine2251-2'-O)-methyltransferase
MAVLSGINPILESLKAGRPLDRILVAKGAASVRLQEIIDLARRASVSVRFEERAGLDRMAGTPAHQGVVAVGAPQKYAQLEDVAPAAQLLVVLDGLEDPHNLGAITRTAHAAGAGGIVIPERRAVGLTDVVAKAAAGALEYMPIVRATNINRTLEELKRLGYWIYGLDQSGEEAYHAIEYHSPTVLVFGGEGKGLHEQVRKHCDVLVRIPMEGHIPSLNVSVAAGIVLFECKLRRSPNS